VVVVMDGARWLRRLCGVFMVLAEGPRVGVYAIRLDSDESQLPEECGAVVINTADGLVLRSQRAEPVIVTGDIVNRPDDRYGQSALDWLAELRTLLVAHPDLGAGDPRIVVLGGNHDVAWDGCLDPEPEARHRWFAETFAGYPHPDLHRPDCRERLLFVRYPGVGLRVALLGSAESGGEAARDEDRALLEQVRPSSRPPRTRAGCASWSTASSGWIPGSSRVACWTGSPRRRDTSPWPPCTTRSRRCRQSRSPPAPASSTQARPSVR
jgi:hypothetical protein